MANNPTLDVLAEIYEYNKARGRNFIDASIPSTTVTVVHCGDGQFCISICDA